MSKHADLSKMKKNEDLNRLLILATKKKRHSKMKRLIIKLKFWLATMHAKRLIKKTKGKK